MRGTHVQRLKGLSPEDAWDLWCSLGVGADKQSALSLFRTFGYHPLIIRVLAGHVAACRPSADLETWLVSNPTVGVGALQIADRSHDILAAALRDVATPQREILYAVAAFRLPVSFETLTALLVGNTKPFPTPGSLISAITDLEDRGLIGWDGDSRSHEMHPTVRTIVWHRLSSRDRARTHLSIVALFDHLDLGGPPDSHGDALEKLIQLY
jgi:hypothetical protein